MSTTNFDDFWAWLRKKQSAATLGGRSTICGQAVDDLLVLTSSGGREYQVTRETVEAYYREAVRQHFEGLTGNKRWVAALVREFLGP